MAVTTGKQETKAIPVGQWQVDPAHSAVEFRVKHMMIATVKGRFTEFEGFLEAGEDGGVQASGTIQVASVDTHEPKRDEHLRSPDFFDVATYPEISFVSTEIVMRDHDGALTFAPRLPERLSRMTFRITYRRRCIEVAIEHDEARYILLYGEPLEVAHHGSPLTVSCGKRVSRPLPPLTARQPPRQPAGRTPATRRPLDLPILRV